MTMTVALIYGGKSGEHEVSLMSGTAIARHINKKHKTLLIGVTKDGRWFLQDEAEFLRVRRDENAVLTISEKAEHQVTVAPGMGKAAFLAGGQPLQIDVVFPALHGTNGEDGTVQGLLEMAGVPYVGCNVTSSALTMDKEKTKALLAAAGIPIVPYVVIKRGDLRDRHVYKAIEKNAMETLGFPLFVKPCSAGSSDGASKASNETELFIAVMEAFFWDDKILIEKAIDARELECAVTGNAIHAAPGDDAESVKVYGPGEILLTHEFYDYNAKYEDSDGVRAPADIPEPLRTKIRDMAVKAYKLVDASGLSRVDFFCDKKSGELYLNEINSIPGFTAISMFPKVCAAEGLSFDALTDLLIDEALLRHKAHAALQTSR